MITGNVRWSKSPLPLTALTALRHEVEVACLVSQKKKWNIFQHFTTFLTNLRKNIVNPLNFDYSLLLWYWLCSIIKKFKFEQFFLFIAVSMPVSISMPFILYSSEWNIVAFCSFFLAHIRIFLYIRSTKHFYSQKIFRHFIFQAIDGLYHSWTECIPSSASSAPFSFPHLFDASFLHFHWFSARKTEWNWFRREFSARRIYLRWDSGTIEHLGSYKSSHWTRQRDYLVSAPFVRKGVQYNQGYFIAREKWPIHILSWAFPDFWPEIAPEENANGIGGFYTLWSDFRNGDISFRYWQAMMWQCCNISTYARGEKHTFLYHIEIKSSFMRNWIFLKIKHRFKIYELNLIAKRIQSFYFSWI